MEKFYAGFWIRFFAGFLDMIFLAPIFMLLVYVSGNGEYTTFSFSNNIQSYSYAAASAKTSFGDFIIYGLSITYIAYFLSSKRQATFGKRIMGIYVGNPDGSKLSTAKALARAAASLVTAASLGLGFLIVIFTREKISLHDFICDTRVFYGRKNV